MKRKLFVGILVMALIGLLLLSGCTKTSIQTFESKCKNSGGEYMQTSNQDYNVCECLGGSGEFSRYAVYYKDVKNTVWNGC